MQELYLRKADFPQQVELIGNRSRRIFPVDIVENRIPVRIAADGTEIVAIPFPHQRLNGSGFMGNQIRDPHAAARSRQPVDLAKGRFPVLIITQVVQDSRCQDDIISLLGQIDNPKIALKYADVAGVDP